MYCNIDSRFAFILKKFSTIWQCRVKFPFQEKRMPRAYLVYNPAAGRYPSRILAERAAALFYRDGWNIRMEQSQTGEHITRLARKAAAEGYDAFIVIGGDGSLNHAAAGLAGTATALGILPAGTANVWAQEICCHTLSWTRWDALEECARQISRGNVHLVDLGYCNQQPFLLWAGAGLDGYIVHNIEPRNRWKKSFAFLHYGASAVWYASRFHGSNIKILADGNEISGHYLLVLASNIHLYAGGMIQLMPDCPVDDGKMDLWLLEGDHLGDTLQRAWDLLTNRSDHSAQITRLPFQHLILESDNPIYVQLDGEPGPPTNKMEIQVKSRALRVMVPQEASQRLFKMSAITSLQSQPEL
jgi:diacylglycerol kinase (ATP)